MSRLPTALALVAALACCSPSSDKTTWRFAIEESTGSVQDAYARKFAQLIEDKSGGAIDVIVYPYGALGTSDHTTEQLYNQTIQFVMASPGHLGKIIPELRATFDRLYRERNFRLLTFFTEGEMAWTTNSEIRAPADFAGVKIRVMTTPLLIAAYQAYGASPTPLSYFEVYSALQLNMIDGQVNPVFAIEEMKFYEVTDVLTFPGHAQFVTSAMTNAAFYDGLDDDQQRWIDETIAELQPYILEVQRGFNAERLDKILAAKKKSGDPMTVVRLTDEQRQPFREASMKVREQFIAEAGPTGKLVLDQLAVAIERASE